MCATTRFSVSTPKFWFSRLFKLFPIRPAPTSSTSESAACRTTSDRCSHPEWSVVDRFDPRNASAGSECEVTHAGAIPKTNPVTSESPNANAKTGTEGFA